MVELKFFSKFIFLFSETLNVKIKSWLPFLFKHKKRNRIRSIPFRLLLLILFLLSFEGILIGLSITRSEKLLTSLKNITSRDNPAIRSVTYANMLLSSIRGTVFEALFQMKSNNTTKVKELIEEADDNATEFQQEVEKLSRLKLQSESIDRIEKLAPLVSEYKKISHNLLLSIFENKSSDETSKLKSSFDKQFNEVQHDLVQLVLQINKLVKETTVGGEDIVRVLILASLIGFSLSLLGAALIFVFIRKDLFRIVKKLEFTTARNLNLSQLVKAKSTLQLKSTEKQSLAVENSNKTLRQINDSMNLTNQNVESSLKVFSTILNRTKLGEELMIKLEQSLEAVRTTNSQIKTITNIMENVSIKTQMINEIVIKTQHLSFNASIEAARAGVHGRGFSVVASEVGKLAVNSGVAADDIKQMLIKSQKEIQGFLDLLETRIQDISQASGEANQAFFEITNYIKTANDQVKAIDSASHNQEVSIEETNKSIEDLNLHSRSNNEMAKESLASTSELQLECENLNETIQELKFLAGSKDKNSPKAS